MIRSVAVLVALVALPTTLIGQSVGQSIDQSFGQPFGKSIYQSTEAPLSPACDCGLPACGCEVDPGCGFEFEPTCGCYDAPACGCYAPAATSILADPTGIVQNEPVCGLGFVGDPSIGCADPGCGLDSEPSFGVNFEPGCGCGSMLTESICGCEFEPSCGVFGLPSQHGGLLNSNLSMPSISNLCGSMSDRLLGGAAKMYRPYFAIGFGFASPHNDATIFGVNPTALSGFPVFDLDAGALGMIGYGVDYGGLRIAAEASFRRNSVDGTLNGTGGLSTDTFTLLGQRNSTTAMVNAYFDMHNRTMLTPYFKTGLGFSRNEASASYTYSANSPALISQLGLTSAGTRSATFPRRSSTNVAWNLGVGVALDLTRRAKFDFTYQYVNVGDAPSGYSPGRDRLEFGNGGIHEFLFGLRFYH